MAEGGGTIGRANVEVGADTTKLSAGLKEAQKETEKAVAQTEQVAKKAEEKSKGSSDGFGFGAAKAAALALVAAVQKLSSGIKEAMRSGQDFARSMRDIETAFRSDIQASLGSVARRREEILRAAEEQKKALDDEIRQRNIIEDLIMWAASDPVAEARLQKIETERAQALSRLSNYQRELDDKTAQEMADRNAEAAAEMLDGEAKERAKYDLLSAKIRKQINETESEDLKRALQEQDRIAWLSMNDRIGKIRKAQSEADKSLQEQRKQDADELMNYWLGINDKIDKNNLETARAMREQFAALRNDINSLFNTGQLEIGINRLSALMEILVQKVGDQR